MPLMALYPTATVVPDRRAGVLRRAWAKVTRRLLPESSTQPKITPRVVILHSAAGRGSLYNFFLRSSSLESHFWVSTAGQVEQYVDTNVRADANRNANPFAISIETESSPSATEPWSPAQYEAIVALVAWCCETHGIPAVICPRWDGSGIGWHIMWGAPGPWTPVAKSCPGPARIRQMPGLVRDVARLLGGATPDPTPNPTKGPLMALTDAEQKRLLETVEANALILRQLQSDLIPPDTEQKGRFAPRVIGALSRLEAAVKDLKAGK